MQTYFMHLSLASPYPVKYDRTNCENEPLNFSATMQAYVCASAYHSPFHDLRAPLRTIEGYSDLLKETYSQALGKAGMYLLYSIKESASKQNELVQGQLAYTRAGRKNRFLNAIPLEDAARQEAKPLMEDAIRQGRNVQLLFVNGLPTVLVDKPALKVLLNNLLSNAFNYSIHSDPAIIEISGPQSNGFAQFYVRDNGIGFDMQNAAHIFGVFIRLVNEEQYEGTGIGLAIAKRIVEKHGGSITVESSPGAGSTFFVRLPNSAP